MSSTLYYKPVTKKDIALTDELKRALQKLENIDVGPGFKVEMVHNQGLIPFLLGMQAAGVKGADTLIKAIEKYGEVELEEIF